MTAAGRNDSDRADESEPSDESPPSVASNDSTMVPFRVTC